MSSTALECLYKETGKNPLASVIWLHGLGADGYDFEPIVEELNLPATTPLRFVFPHAPVRPVTINQFMQMRAWYDIKQAHLDREEDADGVLESVEKVRQLIEAEKSKGFKSHQIFVAGFSQGGAVALYTALGLKEKLAGVLVLSAYLPLMDQNPSASNLAKTQTPVLMMHGKQDPVVAHALGHKSYAWLKSKDCLVEWKDYEMPHSVCHSQVCDIASWLQEKAGK